MQLDIDEMSGLEFEAYVAGVLQNHGYVVSATKASGDFGVDLVARKGKETLAVQCKRHFKPLGAAAVQQVVAGAVMYGCATTMVVSNQTFTPGAVALAQRHNCTLIDGAELSRLASGYSPERVHVLDDRVWELALRPTGFERFSRDARVSVILAQEEARELYSEEVRPEHLLVGVLQCVGCDFARLLSGHGLTADVIRERLASADARDAETFDADAVALRAIGIDLYAIRDRISRTFGPDAWDNASRRSGRRSRRGRHILFTKSAKKALELSLREALAHKDNTIGREHIMLGILRGGDKFTVGLINEHVETSQLRGAIVDLLDKAA